MKRKSVFLSIFLSIFLFLLLFLLLLPSLLSTEKGKQVLIHYLEKELDAKVDIRTLKLSWFSEQYITNATFSKDNSFHVQWESLSTNCSFWNLLWRRGSIGKMIIKKPNLTIFTAPSSKEKTSNGWKNIRGQLFIEEGSYKLFQEDQKELTLNIETLSCNIPSRIAKLRLISKGSTNYNGQTGNFLIDLDLTKEKLKTRLSIHNFPLAVIDPLVASFYPSLRGNLVKILGSTATLTAESNKEKEQVVFITPHLSIHTAIKQQKEQIELFSSKIKWTLTPTLIRIFPFPKVFSLSKPTTLTIDLAHLSFPWDFFSKEFSINSKGTLSLEETTVLLSKNNQLWTIDALALDFSTSAAKREIACSFTTHIYDQNQKNKKMQSSGKIVATGKNPFFSSFSITQLDGEIENGSLALIEYFQKKKRNLVSLFGETFTAKIAYKKDQSLSITANSPKANLSTATFTIANGITLASPTTFSYQLPKTLPIPALSYPIAITGKINHLFLPLENKKITWEKSLFSLDMHAKSIPFSDLLSLGPAKIADLQIQLRSIKKGEYQASGVSRLDFMQTSQGQALIGSSAKLDCKTLIRSGKKWKMDPITFSINSSKLKATLQAKLENNLLLLTKEFSTTLLIPPSLLNPQLPKDRIALLLTKPALMNITITSGSFPLAIAKRPEWYIKGKGLFPLLSLKGKTNTFPFSLNELDFSFEMGGDKKPKKIAMHAYARQKGVAAGKFSLLVKKGGNRSLLPEWEVNLHDFSTSIVDAFLKEKINVTDILGDSLNAKWERSSADLFAIQINSPYLDLKGAFSIRNQQLVLSSAHKPLILSWKMTDAAYRTLQRYRKKGQNPKHPLFSLIGSADVTAEITNLTLPLQSKKENAGFFHWNPYKINIDAHMEVKQLQLKAKNRENITKVSHLEGKVVKKAEGGPLYYELSSTFVHSSKGKGHIRGKGEIKKAWTKAGRLNTNTLSASIHTTIDTVPTLFFDALFALYSGQDSSFSLFLGDSVNASLDIDIANARGEIAADLRTTASQARFLGVVRGGRVMLRKPMQATFTITPKLNALLTKSARVEIVSLSRPSTLYIDPKCFSLPLNDLHLRSANIGYGRLLFHQVVCQNTGNTSDISGIFKLNEQQSSLISLWFAPMEFSMQNGVMHIGRTEILYNNAYQIAIWGNVDYKKRFVSMQLGLTAQALQAALGIQGLYTNYVLAIPIRGPFGNIQLDKSHATKKIAWLIARKQVAPNIGGKWGSIFGAIGDLTDDQSHIPPPKPPFPWNQ